MGNGTENDSTIVDDDTEVTQRGMVLPFTPLSLSFDNVRYSVDMPQVKYGRTPTKSGIDH
jgi:hypothetical protein